MNQRLVAGHPQGKIHLMRANRWLMTGEYSTHGGTLELHCMYTTIAPSKYSPRHHER